MSAPTAYSSDWLGVTDLPAWVPGVRRPARPAERARAARAEGATPQPRAASQTAADPGEIDRRAALLGLLAQDLARGHQRLAIRHYLMLVSLGSPVPAGFSQRCEALVAACPAERLARIRADVASWRIHNRRSAASSGDGFDLRLLEV